MTAAMTDERKLDALVAEKVFGWKLVHWTWHDGSWTRNSAFPPDMIDVLSAAYPYAKPGWIEAGARPNVEIIGACFEGRGFDIPEFSTGMEAAWMVVAHMRDHPNAVLRNLSMVAYCYNRTYATFDCRAFNEYDASTWAEGNGEHATPFAICLAALKAVESEATS